ncbi:MAG: hypothetical protein KKC02_02800 [Gammaproteobacteria bacterium]|nr:hypothetical protein [Gammaproteobacteria bacterium]
MTGSRILCPITAALAICALGLPAAASDVSPLKAAFGAAIVSTHPDGRTAKLWLKADGTYAAEGRKGQKSGGVWAVKKGKLCLSQKRPYPGPFSFCKDIPPVKAGAVWSDKAFNGET